MVFSCQAEGKIVVPWCLKTEGKRKTVIGSHVIPLTLLLTFIHLMPIFPSLNPTEAHWCFPQYGSHRPYLWDEITSFISTIKTVDTFPGSYFFGNLFDCQEAGK